MLKNITMDNFILFYYMSVESWFFWGNDSKTKMCQFWSRICSQCADALDEVFFLYFFLLLAYSALYSCHLFTMSKMATAAVVAWFYELNSNKQRELMARGVEQSEKGNCYKRRQLVYSIYNILWWRHRVIGLLTKYNIYTW